LASSPSDPLIDTNMRLLDPDSQPDAIEQAAQRLAAGELVALPTETVYGLGADAANAAAVARLYAAKGRPADHPVIVHFADAKSAFAWAREVPPGARALAARFWPGPLTLVLPLRAGAAIAPAVTAGLPTIALRCPAHPVMRAVLARAGLPLAAPSANRSGAVSPTRADHVAASLGGAVPLVLDGGACAAGLESTIVALRNLGDEPAGWQLLGPGPIDPEAISAVLGTDPDVVTSAAIEAPGQLASHYAPGKPLRLGAVAADADEWLIGFGNVVGDDTLSASGDLAEAAANLYAALHRADASDHARIAIAPVPMGGMGDAINDRLKRAAA